MAIKVEQKEIEDSCKEINKNRFTKRMCERERDCILRMVFNMATDSPLYIFISLFKSHKRHTSSVV